MQPLQTALVVETVGGPFSFARILRPVPTLPHDILVRVRAVAINPVDVKVKDGGKGGERPGDLFRPEPKIVGYDGAGVVEAVAAATSGRFKPGDEVWWAGSLLRQGSLQQFQLVDERLVSLKPASLSFEQAASLPLTAITAWEAMRERMNVQPGASILITAGAGGVGSIATQLAHHWGLRVIASVSRDETAAWRLAHGPDATVDHKLGIARSFAEQQLPPVQYCLNTYSERLLSDIVPVMAPFGAVCGINSDVSAGEVSAIAAMFSKALSYHFEFMFGKPVHGVRQHEVGELLAQVAALVDRGALVHTMQRRFSWREAGAAYELLASRTTIGKIVMTVEDDDELAS